MAAAEKSSMTIRMLSADDKLAEIKRLYYETTRPTIQQDLAKALDLLRSMANEAERERAAVYMDGLAQMRSEWARQTLAQKKGRRRRKPAVKRSKSER
jgi:hypothetical protein